MIYGKNWEKPYLFIHVPKTGGTSLEEHLVKCSKGIECGTNHNVAFQAKCWLDDFESLYKFGFVRNPFAVELSIYAYHIPSWGGPDGPSGMSFDTWVKWRWTDTPKSILKTNPDMPTDYWKYGWLFGKSPMYGYFCDSRGRIIVDHIARFERLHDEWDNILSHIGVSDKVPHHHYPGYFYNKLDSEYKLQEKTMNFYDYRKQYTPELVDIIGSVKKFDLNAFGYDFEDGLVRDSIIENTDFYWYNLGEQYCYEETYFNVPDRDTKTA